MSADPYHDKKVVHLARHVRPDGAVSALCAKKPRALNLRVATWTTDPHAVTCARCRQLHDRRTPDSLPSPRSHAHG